ncbi:MULTISPECIES: ribonuclease R [Acinetobacter]|jgi:ribonuclease R|uniref:Ribonuclease R n=2 Tax=Acinetobacter gerneri TaxID=202952 RepID=N8ZIL5_9GAMM|nr:MULTISPECIES: ribonuclease R [Acinetobacter]ENV31553.1 ribonuclease R [Acinetobacter gerneri DSM 14967 = CIP 107464 = MTCC 9824]EPR80390.1 3'-to-5' exoribonuclease RNase R [Acinetobacter gerneri DSM 14967 = CIP 107464 = MTCC 9824]MCH4245801.1 ribonuclease R [Acinetobacter gerneri]MDQ9008387.1 ribonuclease R [Acinetobacter gerneri]MDQ9012648.1 ribonuclease R [Acinetobacter gerneri]
MKNWVDPEAKAEAERYDNPIPSRTLILETIEQLKAPQSHADLVEKFEIADQKSIDALSHRLSAMVRDGQLMKDGFKFDLMAAQPTHDATVYINSKGLGVASLDGSRDEMLLPERELRLVFHGDRIKVQQTSVDRKGKAWGYITEVVQRRVKQLIGKLEIYDGEYFIQPSNPNAHQPITLEKELIEHAKANVGEALRVEIDDYPTREELATGHIIQSMADKADTEIIIPQTILEYGLPYEFPEEVIKEAESFKEPSAADRKGRIDLRDLPLVTIDGEDARDFDDAVYAEKRPGGGYRVVVAIADVSHYVRLGKPLDDEAQERGTSVYFPHFVLPMLPEALSNGLCSLNPNVDRLCMVCDLNLSRAGRVTGFEFYPSVMHSKARLTYTQVAQYFDGDSQAVPEDREVRKSLNTLFQMYQVLKGLRAQRHAMEFETIETYMTFDELGGIDQILPRSRNEAHKLIEECMLLANVAAAEYSLKNEIPMLYRVHEPPEFSRIQKVRDFVKLLGLKFPEQPTQADYQAVIEATKDRIDAPSIHAVLLRSMMQAFYGAKNAGHFGLAYDAYTHFTSPIRRYPDLLLHRAIKAHLAQKPYPLSGAALDDAGEHFSQTERRADEASRSVTSWLKCHYMQQHLGEEFVGVISAVTEFGLFVTLKDLYVDGMIHVSQLGDDFFVYDQASQSLVGQNRGQIFGLGDEVKIKVAGVNLEERKIDFELLQQLSHAGRVIRSRAPRVAKATTKEEVFGKAKAPESNLSTDGEKPVRKKKSKNKASSYGKKPAKNAAVKAESKAKDKPKKKVKKKKSNAKTRTE